MTNPDRVFALAALRCLQLRAQSLVTEIDQICIALSGRSNFTVKIDELELSTRSTNCLMDNYIFYIGDLVQKTEAEMLRTPNFGHISLNEIKEVLAQMGLHLGMEVPGWPLESIRHEHEALRSALEIKNITRWGRP